MIRGVDSECGEPVDWAGRPTGRLTEVAESDVVPRLSEGGGNDGGGERDAA